MDTMARQESSAAILCDDIMAEILVRLPPKSILRCRTVSRQWNSLLTSPEFLSFHKRRIGSPRNLLGFFQETRFWTPFLPSGPDDPKLGQSFSSPDLGEFITSSNGLVLCRRRDPTSYNVLNPVTGKHVSLPPPNMNQWGASVGFYCDEDGDDLAPRYEVVIADEYWKSDSNKLCIETYSSDTKEWRESVLIGTSDFKGARYNPLMAVKGVFYWWASYDTLAAYDPRNKDRSNHVRLIQVPSVTCEARWLHSIVLNQTPDGSLIYAAACNEWIEIWQLPRRELEFWRDTTIEEKTWVPIHIFSSQTLCLRSPFIRREEREQPEEEGLRRSSCRTSPWNPVLTQGRSILLYDMETRVLESIMCIPDGLVGRGTEEWHPFFEPTSISSYLLA